jgi:hypothetical protein
MRPSTSLIIPVQKALSRFTPTWWITDPERPGLALAGGASPEHQRNAVARLATVLPDGRNHVIEGQGHQFDPTVVAPVVARFFDTAVRRGHGI